MLEYATALLFPWLIALAITPLVIRWAFAYDYVDYPTSRKAHARPTPDLGGPAIFLPVALGLLLAAPFYEPIRAGAWGAGSLSALGVGVLLVVVLGIVDDRVDLPAPAKALAQAAIAALTWLLGFRVGPVELAAGYVTLDAGALSFVLTVGWIVVLTNAFNLIDGIDGLATGIGLITALTLYLLAIDQRQAVPVIAALALSGSLAGFLRFNLPPARIFLGDSGAMAVGYTAAVISIATYQKGSTAMVVAVPLLAFGLPILEVLLAVFRRGVAHVRAHGLRGARPRAVVQAVFQADRGHIHDLLLRAGWSVRGILLLLYGVCAGFAVIALSMRNAGSTGRWLIVIATVGLGLVALRGLQRRVERMESAAAVESPAERAASRP